MVPIPRISGLASAWSHTARLAAWAAVDRPSGVGSPSAANASRRASMAVSGRHLAGGVAAHAVGHREQRRGHQELVLVGGPDQADVGGRPGAQLDHRRTSMMVLPIWSWSPLRMGDGGGHLLAG